MNYYYRAMYMKKERQGDISIGICVTQLDHQLEYASDFDDLGRRLRGDDCNIEELFIFHVQELKGFERPGHSREVTA